MKAEDYVIQFGGWSRGLALARVCYRPCGEGSIGVFVFSFVFIEAENGVWLLN